jgi:hypothetical protein
MEYVSKEALVAYKDGFVAWFMTSEVPAVPVHVAVGAFAILVAVLMLLSVATQASYGMCSFLLSKT